jgi:hypothetical protein
MTDSYPNSFCTIEHKLSAYPQESDLLSRCHDQFGVIRRTETQLGIQGFMHPPLEL